MQLRTDLALKYLTGTYKIVSDINSCDDMTATIMAIVDYVKSTKKSKKNFTVKDFVITPNGLKEVFDSESIDNIVNTLQSKQYATVDELGTVFLTDLCLSKIFEIND